MLEQGHLTLIKQYLMTPCLRFFLQIYQDGLVIRWAGYEVRETMCSGIFNNTLNGKPDDTIYKDLCLCTLIRGDRILFNFSILFCTASSHYNCEHVDL